MSDDTGIGFGDVGESGNFEEQIQVSPGVETIVDPLVATYNETTSPWSTLPPDVFEVDVEIQVGVTSRIRHDDQQWRKTDTYTSSFELSTTTYTYTEDIGPFVQEIWDFAQTEINRGAVIQLHTAVWLDNPTHPPVAAGVVRLPKGHRDSAFTQQEFTGSDFLEGILNNICSDLKNTARY